MYFYNHERIHRKLKKLTPVKYRCQLAALRLFQCLQKWGHAVLKVSLKITTLFRTKYLFFRFFNFLYHHVHLLFVEYTVAFACKEI
ncbi:IS3 family transposase [Paenibacillus thiaminolyticus]|uniref:IS3 family transposase n=1 Tax=Paenibacillus thiaminolyticus TaxID=49283 RepID=UPI0035A6E736